MKSYYAKFAADGGKPYPLRADTPRLAAAQLLNSAPPASGAVIQVWSESAVRDRLTPDEEKFAASYPDDGPLIVAHDVGDVLRWFGRE